MDYFIPYAVTLVIVFIVFNIALAVYKRYQVNRLQYLVKKLYLELCPDLYTETDNNTIYLYDKKTNKFLCQADTIENLALEYTSNKGSDLAKVLHDNKEIWFVQGDVLDEIEVSVTSQEIK